MFCKKLLTSCECYEYYINEDNFNKMLDKNKIDNPNVTQVFSYMACIEYDNRLEHMAVPIMLGSYLDFMIRGEKRVNESKSFWGAFVLNGALTIYNIFSTFNALSLHVTNSEDVKTKQRKGPSQFVKFYTYVDKVGLQISYHQGEITYKYEPKTWKNFDKNDPEVWLHLLQASNPYTDQYFSASQYIEIYEAMDRVTYVINLLANRHFLSGALIIDKYIHKYFKQGKKTHSLRESFESGTIYTALAKKNILENNDYFKDFGQNYNNQLNEGRSDKVELYLPTVSRATNKSMSNSNILHFPTDAYGFFCTLDTKDRKSAGEHHVLCRDVIISEDSNDFDVYKFFEGMKPDPNVKDIIVLNGYLIGCKMKADFDNLLLLKRSFPYVTTRYFEYISTSGDSWLHIHVSTKQSVLLKYFKQYDCFFSPAEVTKFNLKFDEKYTLSIASSLFPLEVLRSDDPARTTVSINNAKCSLAIRQNLFHEKLMRNSLGTSCFLDRENLDAAYKVAILEENVENIFHDVEIPELDEMKKHVDIDTIKEFQVSENDISANKCLKRLYPATKWRNERTNYQEPKAKKIKILDSNNKSESKKQDIVNYVTTVLSNHKLQPNPIYNMEFWCAFGEDKGFNIEDGFVFDKNTVEKLKGVYYNLHLTITFTFDNKSKVQDVKFLDTTSDYIPGFGQDLLIGMIASKNNAKPKHSKHISISECKINQTNYYLIYFNSFNSKIYKNIQVLGRKVENTFKIFISTEKFAKFGVGIKLTNFSGQKSVCSHVEDLSSVWGIVPNRDNPLLGKKVHAQILLSDISIVSRLVTGQLKHMFLNGSLAIGPNLTFLALCQVNIHPLHPYTNEKIFDIKNDTLTNINGFDSQNLSNVSRIIRNEVSVKEHVSTVLGLHGFKLNFH